MTTPQRRPNSPPPVFTSGGGDIGGWSTNDVEEDKIANQ